MKRFYRSIPFVLTCAIICFGVMTHSSQLRAQVSFNTTLLGHLQYEERASDIWGYVDDSTGIEYAIMGLLTGTSIIDVSTDPANPTEVAFVPGPSSIWRDIKTHSHYAYVTNETGGGLQIIDLSQPDSAFEVASFTIAFTTAHNLYIDAGFAYVIGTNTVGGIWILDLADPEAPGLVSTWNTAYIHDIYVRNDTAYAAAIFEGGSVYILDVADKAAVSQVAHFTYPDGFSHNTWTSDDGQYLYTTDELNNGSLRVWDVLDLSNIAQVGGYRALSNTIIHNVLVKEPFGFISYYVNGLRIVDLSDPTLPVEVGFYDTFLGPDDAGFRGNWGIYPFAPSGNLYISDIDSGFYLVAFDSVRAGSVEGVVSDATTGLPIRGATLHFIEADKSAAGEEDGTYSFYSAEGEHHMIAVGPGYFESDTLALTIVAGETAILDLTLQPFIAISVDLIPVTIELGHSDSATFEVTNLALDSLAFSIRKHHGPLPPTPGAMKSVRRTRGATLKGLFSNVDWSLFRTSFNEQNIPISAAAAFKEIISDPARDMLLGTAPDVISVQAEKTSTHVLFRIFFADRVDMDSAAVVLSLDTDHNAATGIQSELWPPYAVFDIGAEYDVVPILPGVLGLPPLTLLIIDYTFRTTSILADAVSADSNMIEFAVPLSEIGDDDGNMDVAGFSTHLTPGADITSVDLIPNTGHGTLGIGPFSDPEWLSVSPTADTLSLGEASTITVFFDSEGLVGDTVYTAVLFVESVEPYSFVLDIPVTMFVSTEPVAVEDEAAVRPLTYALNQNYPNPFNPVTTIRYSLPKSGVVSLIIYNLIGEEVLRLVDEEQTAGYHKITWDASNMASGIYFYRLQAGDFVLTRKMVLLK